MMPPSIGQAPALRVHKSQAPVEVQQLRRELNMSELALRGMRRRQVEEPPAPESRLLRTEYKAEAAAARRYRAAARAPVAPPEPTGLQRAEAAAERGMRRRQERER